MSEQKRQNETKYPYFCALQRYLKSALKNESKKLAKELGYTSESKCHIAVEKLLQCDKPYEWLYKGHFDFTHTSLSFLQRCERFIGEKGFADEIELARAQKAFHNEVEKARVEAQRLADLRYCLVRIQTDFRRDSQPIHCLAFASGMLYFKLSIKNEWIEKGLEWALQELPQILRKHYEENEGRLGYPYASNIVGYSVLWKNGDEKTTLYFDTQGKRVEKPSEKDTHPRASISV